ncbi:MAG: ABC transporter substrate-binding protein [Alphaproteobacteria bacterium]|nr:ABC transporter substrate-binding protein [Alphaproteobacteria bacterium]
MTGTGARLLVRRSLVAMVFAFAASALPAQAEETAGQWVSELGTKVVEVLKATNDQPKERQSELEAIFLDSFDVPFVAKFVTGRYWKKATPGEQQDLMELLPEYVATIYAGVFAGYDGNGFKVVKERKSTNGTYVQGLIQRNDGPDVAAAFDITKPNGRFLIINTEVEGVSLLVTKRSEFASVLSREGLAGLISRMKDVLAKSSA